MYDQIYNSIMQVCRIRYCNLFFVIRKESCPVDYNIFFNKKSLNKYAIFLNTSTIVGTALLRRLLSPFRSCCYFCLCVFWSRSITIGRVLLLYLGFNAFTIQFNSPRITNNIANRWYHQITTLSLRLPHMQHSITYNLETKTLYFII